MEPLLAKLSDRFPHRRRLIGGAVAALALIVLVTAVLLSAGQSGGSSAAFSASARPGPASAAIPTPTASHLLVQVVGAVRRPGLVALAPGARAIDAIAAAGGPIATADQSGLNLAARVADGQQLLVPVKGQVAAAGGGPPGSTSGGASGGPVSLSSASEAQLETLPRIGPAMAARILAWRAAHGGFSSVSDLAHVGGIGPKTLAGLKDLVVP